MATTLALLAALGLLHRPTVSGVCGQTGRSGHGLHRQLIRPCFLKRPPLHSEGSTLGFGQHLAHDRERLDQWFVLGLGCWR